MNNPVRIMVSAGEVSGDMHAAALVSELRALCPAPIEVYGIGGNLLRQSGAELVAHTEQTAVMGFWEVVKHLRFLTGLLRHMTGLLESRRPDLLLTVDYVDFNMRLAAQARKRGIPTVHYVCPQVWAWRRLRIPKIAKALDRLLVLFPFETNVFDGTGLDVVFVGHPLVDRALETRAEPPPTLPWNAEDGKHSPLKKVALFPGSRASEVQRHLPIILKAARLAESKLGACAFLIPAPSDRIASQIRKALECISEKPGNLVVTVGQSRHALLQADAAIIKSGTSALEAALMLCPSVIVYRVSPVTAAIVRRLIRVPFAGLPNLIAGKEVFKELIQENLTPEALSEELVRLLTDSAARETMIEELKAINASLGEAGTAKRAAKAVMEMLNYETHENGF